MKSFRPQDGKDEPPGPGRNGTFSNEPHARTTNPDARLAREGTGKEAKLTFTGHLLMENRIGLVVDTRPTPATGTAEREAAIAMLNEVPGGPSDHRRCRQSVRRVGLRRRDAGQERDTPPGPEHQRPGSEWLDHSNRRHGANPASRRDRVGWMLQLPTTAYDLVRLPKLLAMP
jgi:hypothetical protein